MFTPQHPKILPLLRAMPTQEVELLVALLNIWHTKGWSPSGTYRVPLSSLPAFAAHRRADELQRLLAPLSRTTPRVSDLGTEVSVTLRPNLANLLIHAGEGAQAAGVAPAQTTSPGAAAPARPERQRGAVARRSPAREEAGLPEQERASERVPDPWEDLVAPAPDLGLPRAAARTDRDPGRQPSRDPALDPERKQALEPGQVPARDHIPAARPAVQPKAGRPIGRHERFRLRMRIWDLLEGPGPKQGPCPPDDPALTTANVEAFVRQHLPNDWRRINLAEIFATPRA